MTTKLAGTLATLLGVAALGACASPGAGDRAGAATCRADAAAALVGQAAPDDATIRHRTGSTMVRRLAPGDAFTEDYRVERVTVTLSDGQVIAASCR